MKTQEEYAREIDKIVIRDLDTCRNDWFDIDKEIFMQPENKNKAFILGTRKTGCDLIVLGGTNCNEGSMDWLFGSLGNENFYVCQPASFYKSQQEIEKVNLPSLGQLNLMAHYMDELNKAFAYVSASPLSSTWYWSSTESSQAVAWYVVFSSGLTGTGNKHVGDMVRAVIDF